MIPPMPARPDVAALAALESVAVHVGRARAALDLVAPDVPPAAADAADVERLRLGLNRGREALERADAELAIASGLVRPVA